MATKKRKQKRSTNTKSIDQKETSTQQQGTQDWRSSKGRGRSQFQSQPRTVGKRYWRG